MILRLSASKSVERLLKIYVDPLNPLSVKSESLVMGPDILNFNELQTDS